jgi:uncharacterized membrane protein YdjX (TVP38/TMEM64 family)
MVAAVTSHRLPMVLLLLVLLGGGVVAWVWIGPQVSWATLARHQDALRHFVAAHPLVAPLLYLLAYVLTAALMQPQAVLLTVLGGLLFGPVFGAALTVVGATSGASILLVVARSALGDVLTQRGGRVVAAARAELQQDGFAILLVLRLVPLFPFWAINLAAAVAGMRLAVFLPATALGIAPACFIYSSIGAGLGDLLAAGRTSEFSEVFEPRVLLPLLGLAALSLLSVVWRRWRAAYG